MERVNMFEYLGVSPDDENEILEQTCYHCRYLPRTDGNLTCIIHKEFRCPDDPICDKFKERSQKKMSFTKKIDAALHSYGNIGKQYVKDREYALTTWKTCPKCESQQMCVLTPDSEIYKCSCGYEGEWLNYPSGFAEYRKGSPLSMEPLWPVKK